MERRSPFERAIQYRALEEFYDLENIRVLMDWEMLVPQLEEIFDTQRGDPAGLGPAGDFPSNPTG